MSASRPVLSPRLRRRHAGRGVVLIEVLVSLLIFAFGVLGLVGLQASMTQAQTAARARGDAASLASELIGQVWSDLPNAANYDTATKCLANTSCSDWTSKVGTVLPSGSAVVNVTTVAATATTPVTSTVSIQLSWSTPGKAGGAHTYTAQATMSPPQ